MKVLNKGEVFFLLPDVSEIEKIHTNHFQDASLLPESNHFKSTVTRWVGSTYTVRTKNNPHRTDLKSTMRTTLRVEC